jgi:hypothetical protein
VNVRERDIHANYHRQLAAKDAEIAALMKEIRIYESDWKRFGGANGARAEIVRLRAALEPIWLACEDRDAALSFDWVEWEEKNGRSVVTRKP